jgi:hypothetical protein
MRSLAAVGKWRCGALSAAKTISLGGPKSISVAAPATSARNRLRVLGRKAATV